MASSLLYDQSYIALLFTLLHFTLLQKDPIRCHFNITQVVPNVHKEKKKEKRVERPWPRLPIQQAIGCQCKKKGHPTTPVIPNTE